VAYLRIMEEIKARVQMIETTKAANLPFGLAREVCFLQLRHIAELIAIGCLAAQGKLTGSSAILNEDNPNKILRELDKYFEFSFPQSTIVTVEERGVHKDTSVLANSKPNALTRREALKMWSNSGNFLHRLTVKKFFSPESPEGDPWSYIDTHVSKIKDLLSQHAITTPLESKGQMILVTMFDAKQRATATVLTFDAKKNEIVGQTHFVLE